jgi:hypothetical protein
MALYAKKSSCRQLNVSPGIFGRSTYQVPIRIHETDDLDVASGDNLFVASNLFQAQFIRMEHGLGLRFGFF